MLIPYNVQTHGRASQHGVVIEIKQTEPQKENEPNKKFAQRINTQIEKVRTQIEQKNTTPNYLPIKYHPKI